jgi:predicted nucleic acid-binding Zn finger protein
MEKLRFSNEREEKANQILAAGGVKQVNAQTISDIRVIGGQVAGKNKNYTTELKVDTDQRMVGGKCDCSFFIQNKLYKGPCEHILATRMAHNRKG